MKKVLVIDDDKTTREILKRAVESHNFSVIQSGNGRHGWETLWENDDIQFIITDMAMPDMDGKELMHLVRNDEQTKNIPVIIVSGCFSSEELAPVIKVSPQNTFFLPKPLDKKLLYQYIDKILKHETTSN
jgi:CheY-like chemotaxis protein